MRLFIREKRIQTMKLTKNQLRKIIKEEVAGVFTEEKASRTIKEAWTSADVGAQAVGDEKKAGLKQDRKSVV